MKHFLLKALTLNLLFASFTFVSVANALATPKAFAETSLSLDSSVQFDEAGNALAAGQYACDANSGATYLTINLTETSVSPSITGRGDVNPLTCDGTLHTYQVVVGVSSDPESRVREFRPGGNGTGFFQLVDASGIGLRTAGTFGEVKVSFTK